MLWREVVRKRAGASREGLGAKERAGQARTLHLNVIACHSMCGRWVATLGGRVRNGESIRSGAACSWSVSPLIIATELPTVPPKAQQGQGTHRSTLCTVIKLYSQ